MATEAKPRRMAVTAAPSASFFLPNPIQRLAAIAAASVTRTNSKARLRSVCCSSVMFIFCFLSGRLNTNHGGVLQHGVQSSNAPQRLPHGSLIGIMRRQYHRHRLARAAATLQHALHGDPVV